MFNFQFSISAMKALFLAFTMNVVPVAPLDILRFLRVPAIVWVLQRSSGVRWHSERSCSPRHRRGRESGDWRRRTP